MSNVIFADAAPSVILTALEKISGCNSVPGPGEAEMAEPALKVVPLIVFVPLQVVPDGAVQRVVKAPPLIDTSYKRTAEAPDGQSNGVAAKATAAVIRTFFLNVDPPDQNPCVQDRVNVVTALTETIPPPAMPYLAGVAYRRAQLEGLVPRPSRRPLCHTLQV
jgi:hypothetical protein